MFRNPIPIFCIFAFLLLARCAGLGENPDRPPHYKDCHGVGGPICN